MQVKEAIILIEEPDNITGAAPLAMTAIDKNPFLEYTLSYLLKYEIDHVVISSGASWKHIFTYFGNRYKTLSISYVVLKNKFNTGGGIENAFEKIKGEHSYIFDAISLFQVDLHDLSEFYFAHNADLSMTVKRKRDFYRFETIEMDVCKVIGILPKCPRTSGLINGGVYICSKQLLRKFDLPDTYDFIEDFLKPQIMKLKICAMRSNEEYLNITLPADIEKAKTTLSFENKN